MTTLANAISTAITKSLLAQLPSEASGKFDINESEFKEFLEHFLAEQLKASTKGARSSAPKGKNGKGRISGYILFSNEHRDEVRSQNPDLKFTEVCKRLGEMWGDLSDSQKASWSARAARQNEENGLPTPTPSQTPAPTQETQNNDEESSHEEEMHVSRHPGSKRFVVNDTNYVVASSKNKVIVGKIRGDKLVALTAADRRKCKENGWPVRNKKNEE